jgi:hypothetical protein
MALLLAPLALMAEAVLNGEASKAALRCGKLHPYPGLLGGSRIELATTVWLENTLAESAFVSVVLVFVAGFLLCFQRVDHYEGGKSSDEEPLVRPPTATASPII